MKTTSDMKSYLTAHRAEIFSGIICATAATIALQFNTIRMQQDILSSQTVIKFNPNI